MRTRLTAVLAMAALPVMAALAAGHDTTPLARWQAEPLTVFDAAEVNLDEFVYAARPVIVFANSPNDPAFIEQMEELAQDGDRLIERDVVILTDTDPLARSDIRLRLRPRSFMLVLMGKDGEVELRKPLPWTVRELSRSIDKMPVRQREMREGG
ncbi:DUF4174 domain-containing protein [Jannaschia sp. LMIT008]|uniref:DUF4174 domain-containing protein n=1 Tax=Jannaschia maritima TaxID=3032585 RepID=UPI002810CD06|nr:DUF4174 domain-containing protein [Jannaschia sp. LMIT008]